MTTNRRINGKIEELEGQIDDLWFWLTIVGGLLCFTIWLVNSGRLTSLQSSSSPDQTVTSSESSEPFKPSKDAPKFIYPHSSPYPITSGFGMRKHPIGGDQRMHNGIDYGAPMGTPILAIADGKVTVAGDMGGCGLTVKITHSGGYESTYCHASQITTKVGASVKAGTPIALVGSTGGSTGPHLHLGIKKDGNWIDPKNLIPSK